MNNPTVNEIYRHIVNSPLNKENTYVILGKPGPTGKTWLTNALNEAGFNAIEISEAILEKVMYKDNYNQNHYIENDLVKVVTIILNRPLNLYERRDKNDKS